MFPPELVCAVIDQISPGASMDVDSNVTLRSCSLVSRPFAEASQRRLFCQLHIGAFDEPDSGRAPDTSRRLAHVLISRPHLASYVKVLGLSGKSFDYTALTLIISSLQNLRHFTLVGTPLLDLYSRTTPLIWQALSGPLSVLCQLPALRHISMRGRSFLSKCTQLRHVKLWDLDFGWRTRPPHVEIATTPVVLESLDVRDAPPPLSCRGSPLNISCLRSLSLTYVSFPSMKSLIQANSLSLRHLSINIGYGTGVSSEDAEIVACAEHLTSIHFTIFSHSLAGIIPWLQGRHLQTINLRLNDVPARSHEGMWRSLDDALKLLPVIAVNVELPKEVMNSEDTLRVGGFGFWLPNSEDRLK
ncbi:hypothetical protein C8J57DRAFT_1345595, partial [Mycena rebaudengoi]